MMNKPFAEIVESSLHEWTAQSWQWNDAPTYGSLVTIEQGPLTLIGLVYEVSTGSMDPSRYPFAYQKTEEELLKEQPQIFEFLKTTFSCLAMGYYQKGKIHHLAPNTPAKIHSFVQPISSDLSKRFFANDQYIHRIFGMSHKVANIDELLLAILHHQKINTDSNNTNMLQFMDTYSLLAGNDYRRIKLFLQRVTESL